MKVVVARHEGDEPIYNTRFLAFATHYGFRPVACRPRRPQTKGKVERPFYFVETNLLSGREFRSLEHLNDVTAWWLAEVADVRIHRQTRRRPIDMHAEEIPHLIPLPERSYEVAEVVYRTVDAEGFISYGQNRYSVPWHYIGQVLSVRITDEEVTVYDPRLEVLARHRRFPPTERHRQSRQGEHLPPRDVAQRREALRQRFADFGAVGRAVPGGAVGRATLWLGPGAEGPGAVGHLSPGRPAGRPGTCRALRRLLGEFRGTHPGRAGPTEDAAGTHGR